MSANLFQNTMYSLREMPWHREGFVAPEPMTIEQVLAVTDSDYIYETTPLTTTVITEDGVRTIDVPNQYATIRRHPVTGWAQAMGVVGNRYQMHGPRMMDKFNQAMLDADVPLETYGLLGDRGQRMFLTYKLPREIRIGDKDVSNMYLFASTSFDGTTATVFRATAVRVVCSNTWAMAANRAIAKASIRHSSLLEGKVQTVREQLELAYEQADELQELGNLLSQVSMRTSDVDEFLAELFPINEDSKTTRAQTIAVNKRDKVWGLLESPTNEAWANTAWGVFNAVTEYADHEARAKSDNARVQRIIEGGADSLKDRALDLLLV
jgi:phage/plasmid-like protein (TIGR03299 family)